MKIYRVTFTPLAELGNLLTFVVEASDQVDAELSGYAAFYRIHGNRSEYARPQVKEVEDEN